MEETHTCHTQHMLATHNQSCSAFSRYYAQVQTAFLSQVFIPCLYLSLSSLSCPFPPYFKNFWAVSTSYRESLCLTQTSFDCPGKAPPLPERKITCRRTKTNFLHRLNTWARQYSHLFFSCISITLPPMGQSWSKWVKFPHSSSS